MRSKFQLNEGEIQRILNLHKTAIIKETKIIPINKRLILEKTYPITLKKREGWNSDGLENNEVVTKIKEISSNKDLVQLNVTFKSDGSEMEVNFQCDKPDVMVIKGDGQMNGSEYRVGENFKNLIKWYCAGKPKKETSDQGGTNQNLTYTTKQFNELEMNTVFSGQAFKYGLPQGTVFSITDEKGKLRTKNATLYKASSGKSDWSKSETSVSYICSTGKFYIKNFKENFYNEVLAKALSNSICKTDPATQSSNDSNKVDKCTIRKPQVDGKITTQDISYYYDGKSKCERGQASKGFSSIEECTKKCVTDKKKEKDDRRKIMPVIDDEDEIVRGGESDSDDNKIGCENRHKTLECRSSQKNCNTESIRAQALINCKCPSNVLDALLRGFPKARTGNPGDYTLKEDGIWGSGSIAAWETCEDLIRRGSSRNDGEDDDDDENTTDDQKVKDEKGSNSNVPKEKDLKLTPEEFAKLIQ